MNESPLCNFKIIEVAPHCLSSLNLIVNYIPQATEIIIKEFNNFAECKLIDLAKLPHLRSLKFCGGEIKLDDLLTCLLGFRGPLNVYLCRCRIITVETSGNQLKVEILKLKGIELDFQ